MPTRELVTRDAHRIALGGQAVDYVLENSGPEGAYDEGHVFTVKAGSTFTLLIKNVPDPSKLSLTFKALNTYTAPREHLSVQLRDMTP